MHYFRTLLALLTLSACDRAAGAGHAGDSELARDAVTVTRTDSSARARQDSINRAQPGYVVDSILPVDEEIRRFKAATGGRATTTLTGGAASRASLVAQFAAAVTANDRAALSSLAVTPREFIDLIYPESPYVRPPYRQSPALLWSQIQMPSATGLRRLTERLGGKPLRIDSLSCAAPPERQGENRLHTRCVVRFASGGNAVRDGRLFGTIIERHGRYKFVSYANMY